MLQKLMGTDDSAATAILRVVLGIVFFAHGAQKMLGWFGGYGFTGTMGFFTETMHIPTVFALLAISAEFFGSLGLIAGLLTRVAAFGITAVMLVALTVHSQFGFFANWSGTQKGEGVEFHLLVIAMTTFLMIKGAGAFSLDRDPGAGRKQRPGARAARCRMMKANPDLTAPKLWIVFARCYRVMAQWAERSIADLGICTSDFMVLEALLHKGPLTISEIQGKVLLASGSMTAAVDRVESLGLVIRTTTAKDRRARVLELTPKGRKMIEKAYAEHAEQLEAAMSVLDAGEKQALYEMLKRLGHSVASG